MSETLYHRIAVVIPENEMESFKLAGWDHTEIGSNLQIISRELLEQLLEQAAQGAMAHTKAALSNYKGPARKLQRIADEKYAGVRAKLDEIYKPDPVREPVDEPAAP